MKIEFDEVIEYFKSIAEKEGCSEKQARNIASRAWHWLDAKMAGITIEQYSDIKDLNAHATKYQEIARITGVPIQKVHKVVKRGS